MTIEPKKKRKRNKIKKVTTKNRLHTANRIACTFVVVGDNALRFTITFFFIFYLSVRPLFISRSGKMSVRRFSWTETAWRRVQPHMLPRFGPSKGGYTSVYFGSKRVFFFVFIRPRVCGTRSKTLHGKQHLSSSFCVCYTKRYILRNFFVHYTG